MSLWKCGRCGKSYEFEEFIGLPSIQAVPEDTNPRQQHGFTPVCTCGYVFGKDNLHLNNLLTNGLRVSTVFLELEHGNGLWFETMVFDVDKDIIYQERYETEHKARATHAEIVEAITNDRFLVMKDDQNESRRLVWSIPPREKKPQKKTNVRIDGMLDGLP